MTATVSATPLTAPEHGPVTVLAEDHGAKLAALAAMYDTAKATADAAAKKFDTIKAAIKVELTQADPDATDLRLESEYLAKPLRLHYVATNRLNSKRFQADQPDVYASYCEPGGYWDFRAVTG